MSIERTMVRSAVAFRSGSEGNTSCLVMVRAGAVYEPIAHESLSRDLGDLHPARSSHREGESRIRTAVLPVKGASDCGAAEGGPQQGESGRSKHTPDAVPGKLTQATDRIRMGLLWPPVTIRHMAKPTVCRQTPEVGAP